MKQRVSGIDLVKSFAIFFVISVHFFLNTKFYQTPIVGGNMFLQLNMRWLFFTCVPLFLIVTGYLQCEKSFNMKYMAKLGNLLLSYVLISLISIWYRISMLGESYTIKSIVKVVLNFTGNGYSWYIEMYIGLFLLIPFLNLLINNLSTKKNKLYFILVLMLLCSVSEFGLLSDYWSILYPILYYMIGAFIRQNQIKIPKLLNLNIIILLIVIESIITGIFANRYNYNLFGILFDGYGKILTLVLSVLIFLCIYDLKIQNKKVLVLIKNISETTFEIYLFSFIFDLYFYQKFMNMFYNSQQQFLKYYFLIVPLVFIFSYFSAYVFKYFLGELVTYIDKIKLLIINLRRKYEKVKKQE